MEASTEIDDLEEKEEILCNGKILREISLLSIIIRKNLQVFKIFSLSFRGKTLVLFELKYNKEKIA